MSDMSTEPIPPRALPPDPYPAASEDRVIAAIIYALFLIGLSNGLTAFIGLILAYVAQGEAGPKMRSHYVFLIYTFWTCALWAFLGGIVIALGGMLMIILIGFPIMAVGMGLLGLTWLWFLIRTVVGAIYLAQDQAYPRPRNWVI